MEKKFKKSRAKKPLEIRSDSRLIKSVKKNADNESFNEICRRYENLFYKVCQKYATRLQICGINVKDIFDEKNFIIYHCVHTYKTGYKTKLSTWIGNYARYLCLNSINARKFILPSDNDEVQKHIEETQVKHDFENNKNFIDNFDYVFNILSQIKDNRITDVFKYRYCGDKKMIWSKVAEKMDLSTQTVVNLHDKGLKLLKTKLNSKNISDII